MEEKFIYVILSSTPSKFAKFIRFFSRTKYNHASLAFDEDLKEMWAFARKKNNLPIDAGVVPEFPERFTLMKEDDVPVRIYEVPVSAEQYNRIHDKVMEVHQDEKYHYNFFSMLLYPIFKGFKVPKTYTCSEFVAGILHEYSGIYVNQPNESVIPEQLHIYLKDYLIYEGNLLEYRDFDPVESEFFDSINPLRIATSTALIVGIIFFRSSRKASLTMLDRVEVRR